MATAYVLYNSHAGRGIYEDDLRALYVVIKDEISFVDVTDDLIYKKTLSSLKEEDYLIVCGGDGTLNRFVNFTDGMNIKNKIFYLPLGTGNDFAHDLGRLGGNTPFQVTDYLKELPTVEVNGKTFRFINGVGYGIDGYCCQVGDEMKKKGKKKVNYTLIAIKGLLFHYRPTNAKVTVDGNSYSYKKVWLAPTMHGRYYGGGMIPTPNQKRNNEDGKLSLMVFYGAGKLRTLAVFPSIFKGEHVKHTNMVAIHEGREITVEFDRPSPLQIDGETVFGVTKYRACGNSKKD